MNTKQVLIWRNDLRNVHGQKVRTGKIAAQLAHASMGVILKACFKGASHDDDNQPTDQQYILMMREGSPLQHWFTGKFTKICVYVNSEQELLDLEVKAKEAGLLNCLITDSGLTEFNNVATITALAIGPALSEDIDKITGHLPLL